MKWFKHLSGSLSNSIIFEAIEKFGSDGYLVFFGTLELMSDEFDIFNPGINRLSIKKMTKSFQLSRQKTVKILRYFDQKAKENMKKKVSFLVDIEKDFIVINCKRLAELCDNHTSKLLKDALKLLQSKNEVTSSQEAEAEAEADLSKSNNEAFSLASQDEINEASIIKIDEDINLICEKLHKEKIFEQVYKFKNAMIKAGKNKRAILHALSRCYLKRKFEKGAYAYCQYIMKIENGNYNERDHLKTSP